MNKHIVLLSKDATLPSYMGVYGGKYVSTPNIDELAAKGTVFANHYTAAPSTAMAFAAMSTGKYPYEMGYSHYYEVEEYQGKTLFDQLYDEGYECHILWSNNYVDKAEKYTKCYGKNTIHHNKMKFNQSCGFNAVFEKKVRDRDDELTEKVFQEILMEIDTIEYSVKPIFLWVHMPHCIYGRRSYGDDMDIFDRLVGEMRSRFGDDNIFITADHGHMNGTRHKAGYGFDVYDDAVRIPLITPRINNCSRIEFLTSNVQLKDIILKHEVEPLEHTFCDSAYYAQPSRKLAIIKGKYSYIYNKHNGSEELYDMEFDPNQEINLLESPLWKDEDRHCYTDIRQVILYPHWDSVDLVANDFRDIRKSIWRNGTYTQELQQRLRTVKLSMIYAIKGFLRNIRAKRPMKK